MAGSRSRHRRFPICGHASAAALLVAEPVHLRALPLRAYALFVGQQKSSVYYPLSPTLSPASRGRGRILRAENDAMEAYTIRERRLPLSPASRGRGRMLRAEDDAMEAYTRGECRLPSPRPSPPLRGG